jgi:hypothetical protein
MENVAEKVATAPRGVWILVVSVVIIVAFAAYMYFRPLAQMVTALGPYVLSANGTSQPSESTQVTLFDQAQLASNLGNNFSFSGFFYVDQVNTTRLGSGPAGTFRFKPLITLLGVGAIAVDPVYQKARVTLKQYNGGGLATLPDINIDISNFVVMRWNQLAVTVEGRSVDVYLNGALITSELMENVPNMRPVGVILETVPDFVGQAGLFQAWSRRLTESEIAANYARNVDTRGKPYIPDKSGVSWNDVLSQISANICKIGFCGYRFDVGPLQYVDYEYA